MRSDNDLSNSEIVLACLGVIWTPGGEALKLRINLNIHSMEDICDAAERAGYEVCYVDLPEKVSGFAGVIGGKPHIVVNRAKPLEHQRCTVAHELGHHVMHMNPTQAVQPLGPLTEELEEFQAQMFAATMVLGATNDGDREVVIKQNPELLAIHVAAVFITIATVVIMLIIYLCSRLFPIEHSSMEARK